MSALSEALLAVADNIEKNGHYQGVDDTPESEGNFSCCIVANPAYPLGSALADKIINAVGTHLGLTSAVGLKLNKEVTDWNDATPTAEVLRVLREIAEEKA